MVSLLVVSFLFACVSCIIIFPVFSICNGHFRVVHTVTVL